MTFQCRTILPLFLLLGCGQKNPDLDRLATTYSDLVQFRQARTFAGAQAVLSPMDSTAYLREVDSLLHRHGFTRNEFTSRISSLSHDPAAYEAFFSRVQIHLRTPPDSAGF